MELRRRAVRHLEAMRGTPMAPNADASQLGDEACPIYRPDVKGIAYWELEIAGVKSVSRKSRRRRQAPAEHERLHRRLDRQARRACAALELRARAAEPRPRSADEGRTGREGREARLARIRGGGCEGQVPDAPRPVPADAERAPGRAAEGASGRLARVASHDGDEDRQRVAKQAAKRTGQKATKPKVEPWPTWGQAKKQYATAYKLHLGALKEHAAPAWEIEDLVAKFGEGIHQGDRVIVPLLGAGKAELAGDGAKSVKMRMLDRNPPAVELLVGGAAEKQEQEFQLKLTYRGGASETLTFFVVPEGTPSNHREALPHPVPVLPPR
jgi:hypothetical protein